MPLAGCRWKNTRKIATAGRLKGPSRKQTKKIIEDAEHFGIDNPAVIPHWHPNQLRHTAATMIRKEFGLEAAQVILGHSKADTTQIYAERDAAKAIEIIRKIG